MMGAADQLRGARAAATGSDVYDLAFQRPENPQQLLLQRRRNVELVQRFDEIIDQRAEVGVSDVHAVMHGHHRWALIDAGATCRLADLVNQRGLELWNAMVFDRGYKEAVDPRIGGDLVFNEILD